MFTLFAIPKAFRGHTGIIQRNAILSWSLLEPKPELILFGNDEGVGEMASQVQAKHIPDVACTEYGTPLISDVFQKARTTAQNSVLCYANSDIILIKSFTDAVRKVVSEMKQFLIVGQRWDLDVNDPIDFVPGWQQELQNRVTQNGKLHGVWAIDYFVFPRELGADMPSFAIGRPAWDNWFIYSARKKGSAVIDATPSLIAVHQNHDYGHVPLGSGKTYQGPEANRNLQLAGEFESLYSLLDATHRLMPDRIVRNFDRSRIFRELDTLPTMHPASAPFVSAIRMAIKITKPVRSWFSSNKKTSGAF